MKFKSLLKIGLPLLGTTALAVSLPLALTSCSNSDELDTFSVNDKNITPSEQQLQTNVPVKVNVPEEYLNKEGESKYSYEWQYKVKGSEKVVLASENGWNKLDAKVEFDATNKDQINLNINPVFFYNNGAFRSELRLLVKEKISDTETKDVIASESITFTKPQGFKLSNVVDTTSQKINSFKTNSASIFGDALVGQEEKLENGTGIVLNKDNQDIVPSKSNTPTTTLFVKLANSLGIDKPVEEVKSITLKAEKGQSGLKNEANPTISLNVKLNEEGAKEDMSKANLWSSEVLLNDEGYTINNYDSLTIDGLNAKLEENKVDTPIEIDSTISGEITKILNAQLGANWTSLNTGSSVNEKQTSVKEALNNITGIEDKVDSVTITLNNSVSGANQEASVVITFVNNQKITLASGINSTFTLGGNETTGFTLTTVSPIITGIANQTKPNVGVVGTSDPKEVKKLTEAANNGITKEMLKESGAFVQQEQKDTTYQITKDKQLGQKILDLLDLENDEVQSITVNNPTNVTIDKDFTLSNVTITLASGNKWEEALVSGASGNGYTLTDVNSPMVITTINTNVKGTLPKPSVAVGTNDPENVKKLTEAANNGITTDMLKADSTFTQINQTQNYNISKTSQLGAQIIKLLSLNADDVQSMSIENPTAPNADTEFTMSNLTITLVEGKVWQTELVGQGTNNGYTLTKADDALVIASVPTKTKGLSASTPVGTKDPTNITKLSNAGASGNNILKTDLVPGSFQQVASSNNYTIVKTSNLGTKILAILDLTPTDVESITIENPTKPSASANFEMNNLTIKLASGKEWQSELVNNESKSGYQLDSATGNLVVTKVSTDVKGVDEETDDTGTFYTIFKR